MSNFRALHNSARAEKINLDELYEYKKMSDSNTLKSYNKIIERIHTRIRLTSRQKSNQQCCWFVIPEVQIGIPKYDVGSCIAYIMKELSDNGFQLRYTHPNLIFISWNHWVPDYARMELKKQTGVVIDGFGNKIRQREDQPQLSAISSGGDNILINTKLEVKKGGQLQAKTQFKPTGSYKPKGNLVYGEELFNKIDRVAS